MARNSLLAACIVAAFALANGGEACAVFLPLEFEESAGASFDDVGSAPYVRPVEQESPADPLRTEFNPGDGLSGVGTSTGGSSNVAPSGVAGAVLAPVMTSASGGQLVAYRLRESRCSLAVPFLSGIFRPPRG